MEKDLFRLLKTGVSFEKKHLPPRMKPTSDGAPKSTSKKTRIHTMGDNIPLPIERFEALKEKYDAPDQLLHNLKAMHLIEPSPIQKQAIPVLMKACFW